MTFGRRLVATYRVQLQKDFGFDDAADIADYLAELGVSHLYCSPYLQARLGSMHGYDVVDHRSFNSELGGPMGHERLHEALTKNNLGQILDIVPNHMAVNDERNKWWWDVLENGQTSRYASYFDIDWDSPQEPSLHNKVLLPILGDHYGRILEAGELQVKREDDTVRIHYYDHRFPVSPESLKTLGAPIDEALEKLNRDRNALHELLEKQHYRLSYWRTAAYELDYRRFFDVNDLAGLRIEDPQVFDDVHWLIFQLVQNGRVQGLRVDHVDGLRDPKGYLEELREASGAQHVFVEKILEPGEELPEEWPVEGTTGYDFLNRVGGLFVDPSGEGSLSEIYAEFIGENVDLEIMTLEKKRLVLDQLLASDVERLVVLFAKVCERHLHFRDFTRFEARQALRSTMGSFHVYRTYVHPDTAEASKADLGYIDAAIEAAKARRTDLDPNLFDFLRSILGGEFPRDPERELFARFQQATGPVMAKAVEDTLFYNFNRLIALNEVGGDPGHFGSSLEEFHEATARTQQTMPESLLTTSTHDTKRSEDVRSRIALLSEIPEQWSAAINRWAAINERYRQNDMPDRNSEYLLYQTLVGAWPVTAERAVAYMEKASKEAKARTSWIDPDPAFDQALRHFIENSMADETFVDELATFVQPLIGAGRVNALAQKLITLTAPGVPDIYQGNEVWDLSLVDPDNRRPVDYAARRRLLDRVKGTDASGALAFMEEGGPKMWLTHRALQVRRHHPQAFEGDYEPIYAEGDRAQHVVAFRRGEDVITIVPRLVLGLRDGWGRTTLGLPAGSWRDALCDKALSGTEDVSEMLGTFPVALLVRTGEGR